MCKERRSSHPYIFDFWSIYIYNLPINRFKQLYVTNLPINRLKQLYTYKLSIKRLKRLSIYIYIHSRSTALSDYIYKLPIILRQYIYIYMDNMHEGRSNLCKEGRSSHTNSMCQPSYINVYI